MYEYLKQDFDRGSPVGHGRSQQTYESNQNENKIVESFVSSRYCRGPVAQDSRHQSEERLELRRFEQEEEGPVNLNFAGLAFKSSRTHSTSYGSTNRPLDEFGPARGGQASPDRRPYEEGFAENLHNYR